MPRRLLPLKPSNSWMTLTCTVAGSDRRLAAAGLGCAPVVVESWLFCVVLLVGPCHQHTEMMISAQVG